MAVRSLGWVALAVALGGCAGTGGVYRVENATGQPIPGHALADEIYLDGTGPSARMLARRPSTPTVERSNSQQPSIPIRATVRARPTAIEGADNAPVTTGTIGARSAVTRDAKSFHDWVEEEKRQDARMRTIMNICQGC